MKQLALLVAASTLGCAGEAPPPPRPSPPSLGVVSVDPGPLFEAGAPPAVATPHLAYPATRVADVAEDHFGVTVHDPYRWLEDDTQPEVKAWMKEQAGFARASLGKLPERDALTTRLSELSYVEGMGTPVVRGGRYFLWHKDKTAEKWALLYRPRKGAPDKVLLDPNAWPATDNDTLGNWWPSRDGKRVAYTVKKHNADESTMYVLEVDTGKRSAIDVIPGAKYAHASWTPGSDGFYYVFLPEPPGVSAAERPGYAELRFHKLGTDPQKDPLVREATHDAKTFLDGRVSHDGRWLVAEVAHGWRSNDVYLQDLHAKTPRWVTLVEGKDAHFDVGMAYGKLYVTTNEGAPKSRVFAVDPARYERADWKEIVPERPDATLSDVTFVGGKLSLTYLKDVVSELEVREPDGTKVRTIALPAVGSAAGLSGEVDSDEAYYSFTSFLHPTEIYETSVKGGGAKLFYRTEVPVDPSKFQVTQEFATSKDGTKVPVFILRGVDAKKDGSHPTILYGYGGFEISLLPKFDARLYPWLEKGGVYAIANLRGGSEYGEDWHRAGMLHAKQNVFDDYFAAAQHLIDAGYTRPSKLVARGGSNGGLLVGAALTQRPDLFRAGLCGVPLLDMVRYPLVRSGKTWVGEYGSPEDAGDFAALYAYSPYHHVKPHTRYPSMLILSADSDDRVDPMHARKFAALMQASSTGGPVLLRIEESAGHGGADRVKSTVEKTADELAFALAETSH